MTTKQEVKHTPTPWKLYSYEGPTMSVPYRFMGPDANHIGEVATRTREENTANAAFIVRAVNSHEALLDIAYRMIPYLEDMIDDADEGNGPGRYYKSPAIKGLLKLVKDSIDQAEGK